MAYYYTDGAGESLTHTNIDKTYVDQDTEIKAGSGLTSGGKLTSDVTLNVGAGGGITVEENTVSHTTTSTQGSVTNTLNNFIQSISIDDDDTTIGFGHITGITSGEITASMIGAAPTDHTHTVLGTSVTSTLTTTSSTEAEFKAVTPAQGTSATSNDVRLTLTSTFTSGSDPDDDTENEGNASIYLDGANDWYITSHYDHGFTINDSGLSDDEARFYMSEGSDTQFNDSYGNRQLSLDEYGNGPVFEGHSGNMYLTIKNDNTGNSTGIKMYDDTSGWAMLNDSNKNFQILASTNNGSSAERIAMHCNHTHGSVYLYYNTDVKLETLTDGVEIHGILDVFRNADEPTDTPVELHLTHNNSDLNGDGWNEEVKLVFNVKNVARYHAHIDDTSAFSLSQSDASGSYSGTKAIIWMMANQGATLNWRGETGSGNKLRVTDTGVTVYGTVNETSDIRLKTDIQLIPNALDKITKLNGYTYKRLGNGIIKRETGIIAQELQAVLPEAVEEIADNAGTEYDPSISDITDKFKDEPVLAVAYSSLAGVFVEAIKELKDEINALKAEVAELKQGS